MHNQAIQPLKRIAEYKSSQSRQRPQTPHKLSLTTEPRRSESGPLGQA